MSLYQRAVLQDLGADHSTEATGWPIRSGPAGGRLVGARRRENDRTTTTRGDKRRTLEDRSDRESAYRRGECKKPRNRAGGPPAGSSARYERSPSFALSVLFVYPAPYIQAIIIEPARYIDAINQNTLPNIARWMIQFVRALIQSRYLARVITRWKKICRIEIFSKEPRV